MTNIISGDNRGLECVACPIGYYSSEKASDTCKECESPNVSLVTGQSTCAKCLAGTGYESSSSCKICKGGEFRDEGICKPCPFNHISEG